MATLHEWRRPASEAWWALAGYTCVYVLVDGWLVASLPSSPSSTQIAAVVAWTTALSVVGAILAYRVFAHARVLATADGLVIANPFRGVMRLRWDDIESMRADRLLTLRLTSGRTVVAWAIQKNGIDRVRGHRTSADDAIAIMGSIATASSGRDVAYAAS
jgi:lipid-A-disaccharide synthase-like uncharacterized protein